MAYPIFYPFKVRHYNATSTSSQGTQSVPVVARGKLLSVAAAPNGTNQTATAGEFSVTVNGTTATGMGSIAATSGVAGVIQYSGSPTGVVYVNQGDVLATVASSLVGCTYTFVVQEF